MNCLHSSSPLYFIHGGTAEDFLIPPILKSSKQWHLRVEIITSADCIGSVAFEVVRKVRKFLFDSTHTPLGLSEARPVNPFPWAWRTQCLEIKNIGLLKKDFAVNQEDELTEHHIENAEILLEKLLTQEENESVTFLVTCPWTPIQIVLEKQPLLKTKIKQLFCMGGTFKAGNIFPEVVGHLKKPYSEWNMFWDPPAIAWIFKNTEFPLFFVTTETCEKAEIKKDIFLSPLEKQGESSRLSKLAFEICQIASKETAYRLWNLMTLLCLLHTDLYSLKTLLKVKIVTNPFSEKEGALEKDQNGRQISVIEEIHNMEAFYHYLLDYLNK